MSCQRSPVSRVLVKLGLLVAAIDSITESFFELGKVKDVVVAPPSAPGDKKIIEHFAVQHVVFPAVALTLALKPSAAASFITSRAARNFLAAMSAAVLLPEVVVSFKEGDLFRRGPGSRSSYLKNAGMVKLGDRDLNLIHTQHLAFHHILLTVVLTILARNPKALNWFND